MIKTNRFEDICSFGSVLKWFCIVILFCKSSCSNNEQAHQDNATGTGLEGYQHFFETNRSEFEDLAHKVSREYLLDSLNFHKKRIIINSCFVNHYGCDRQLQKWLDTLKIARIEIEKDYCDTTRFEFDKISLLVLKEEYYPTVSYIYNLCGDSESYESSSMKIKKIDKKWSLRVEYD